MLGAVILLTVQVEEFEEPELLIGFPPSDGGSMPPSPPPPHENKKIVTRENRYAFFILVTL